MSRMNFPLGIRSTVAACFTALALTSTYAVAEAPSWFGQTADGTWYAGARVSKVDYGTNSEDFKNATNLEVVGGYEFTRAVHDKGGTAAFEVEIGGTISDGEVQNSGGLDWNVKTIGGYFVYRTPGDIYAKARLGIQHAKIELSRDEGDLSDTHIGYGGGIGVRVNNFMIELEYTSTLGDANMNRAQLSGIYRF
jgi:hypothetical protein